MSHCIPVPAMCACRYYDGQLVSDDVEVSGAAGALRDVVLTPPPPDAPPGVMPMAATAAAAAGRPAAAGGSSSGVLLSRAYGESQLYTQVRGCCVMGQLMMYGQSPCLPVACLKQGGEAARHAGRHACLPAVSLPAWQCDCLQVCLGRILLI
jgi:hypothetical protein